MARKRITQLSAITSATDADVLHIGQSAADKSMTWANVRGQLFKTAKYYGAAGNDIADDRAAIVSGLTSSDHLVFEAGNYRVLTNLTIASSKTLIFQQGAILKPETGVTITIAGAIIAPEQQIFGGNGTVEITSTHSSPKWWGLTSYPLVVVATRTVLKTIPSKSGVKFAMIAEPEDPLLAVLYSFTAADSETPDEVSIIAANDGGGNWHVRL